MTRFAYALLLGVVGAGIVHIVVLLLLPGMSEKDAWGRLAASGDLYAVVPVGEGSDARPVLRAMDPLFEAVACRFDLGDGLLHFTAAGHAPFWSASIYDRNGRNIYSLNDHTSTEGDLDLVVVTSSQMLEIRKQLPAGLEKSIFVEADIDEGILVARAFVPDESLRPAVSAFLANADCAAE